MKISWTNARPYLTDFSVLLAIGLSIYSLMHGISQDKRMDSIEFDRNEAEHRPLLKFIGDPQLIEFRSSVSEGMDSVRIFMDSSQNPVVPEFRIVGAMTLKFRFRIANIGNSVARVAGDLTSDTTSGGDFLRDHLFDPDAKRVNPPYFEEFHIFPGDTNSLEEEFAVAHFDKDQFTLHTLVIYCNELNNFFDTYGWTRCSSEPIEFDQTQAFIGDSIRYIRHWKKNPMKTIQIVGVNQASKAYGKEESEKIVSFLRQLSRVQPSRN